MAAVRRGVLVAERPTGDMLSFWVTGCTDGMIVELTADRVQPAIRWSRVSNVDPRQIRIVGGDILNSLNIIYYVPQNLHRPLWVRTGKAGVEDVPALPWRWSMEKEKHLWPGWPRWDFGFKKPRARPRYPSYWLLIARRPQRWKRAFNSGRDGEKPASRFAMSSICFRERFCRIA